MHRARYLEERVRQVQAWEKLPKHREIVFPSTAGAVLDHTSLNRQHFKPLLKKAGLPPMRPYDLRHFFATLRIESGESSEDLQKILGHSSTKRPSTPTVTSRRATSGSPSDASGTPWGGRARNPVGDMAETLA